MSNRVNLGLGDVLRADSVKRWQIVDILKDQSLAEHTYGVAMIAIELAKRLGADQSRALFAAVLHDMPEVITGDIPTPVKEVLAVRDRIDEIEKEIYFSGVNLNTFEDVAHIVKQADLLESCWFLRHRRGLGPHPTSVYNKLVDRLRQYPTAFALWLELCVHVPVEIDEVYNAKKA
jgi:5'-deoxynucleotidase YfbR-like HD superfamily hydrolase